MLTALLSYIKQQAKLVKIKTDGSRLSGDAHIGSCATPGTLYRILNTKKFTGISLHWH
jgi:hypothetical protein